VPKSENPLARVGVYKTLEEVPDHSRLSIYESAYDGRDVWGEYVATVLSDAAETVQYETGLVEKTWKSHMAQRGRHHALATPADIESLFSELLDRMQTKRAYNPYWVRLEEFYAYLMWHTGHPHAYHPPRMAAGQNGAARTVWKYKVRQRKS